MASSTTVVLAFLTCGFPTLVQADPQSSPEDRERIVSVVQNLERAPLDPVSRKDRAWAIQWLTDAPDVTIEACLGSIGGVSEKTYAHAPEVIGQYMIAMAAFIIRNPKQQSNSEAQQLAGVESALAAYKSMRINQLFAKPAALEKLLVLQSQGKLSDFVRKEYPRCSAEVVDDAIPVLASVKPVVWEMIWDQPNIAVIFANGSSVAGAGNRRYVTTRTVYRTPLPEGYIAERIRVEEFDCARRRSRVRSVTIVANDARMPQTVDWAAGKSEWETHDIASLGAAKNSIACGPTARAE